MLLHFIFYTLFTHNIGHGLQPSEMTYYNYPHEKTIIHQDLDEIRTKLLNKSDEQKNVLQSCSALRVHSMRQNYSKDMLEQFYNEQMIPHFPLEDERDSLEDWIYCLDPEKVVTHDEQEKLWPVMDILLLVCDVNVNDESISSGDETDTDTDKTLIFAGVAFEYYQRAEVGLVSYVTVHSSFRKLGIMKLLHPLAIQALKGLHSESHWKRYGALPDHEIKVIFAETNTVDAKDASAEEISNRHRALFALGYRLVECPYSQPPLATDQEAFDDVMLLVYQGGGIGDGNAGGSTWFDGQIPSIFPHEFIVDFFMSVYPDTTGEYSELKNDGNVLPFKDHRCYKLSKWFAENNFYATIKPDLPWKDVAKKYEQAYDAEEAGRVNDSKYDHRDVVAVIGAGAAGLSAAIQIAKISTSPVLVKLIEANDFVGGRIRTIITSGDMDGEQYVDKQLVDKCKPFAPWPVPIGAEFVHGVDSVINDMIEEKEWRAEETFDFCATDEYPSRNSFTVRDLTASLSVRQRKSSLIKIFGGGRCWDLKNPHRDTDNDSDGQSYGLLIKKANEVWDELYSVGDDVLSDRKGSIPSDMSLSTFIEQKMEGSSKDEVDAVKQILDAVYAKTAGSSIDNYGVNEACKEELSWDYTESNFRTERCFAEIVNHYLEQIESINRSFEIGESKGMVEIIKSTPIVKIGCGDNSKVMLSSRDGKQFTCDKVIVAVPLGVLKADKIQFCDDFSLPPEKKLAIEKINFFSGMKAHMLLRKGPSPSLETTDLFFCPGEIFSQVWVRRNEESIFLTGFVVANGRDQLLAEMKKTHKTSQNIFLNQLQRMLPNEIGDNACTAFELHDWSEDEFVMGLYSSPSVGAGWKLSGHYDEQVLETSRDDIKSPIRNTVYFAGEHVNVKTCATVQAAVESGLIAATDVLQSLVKGGKINM